MLIIVNQRGFELRGTIIGFIIKKNNLKRFM